MYKELRHVVSKFDDYIATCNEAAISDEAFNKFKSDKRYQWVLEHVSKEQGDEYLKIISNEYPHLLKSDYLSKFSQNDKLGSPVKYDYDKIGEFSPTTLRYIKVAGDLEKLIDMSKIKSVSEIGGGYGGQSKILNDYFKLENYTIVDLAEVAKLINKYIKVANIKNTKAINLDENKTTIASDLVISNYAFSELLKDTQDEYLEKVIKHAKFGYFTCNNIYDLIQTRVSSKQYGYNKEELIAVLKKYGFKVQVLEERPLTANGNYLLLFNK